MLLTKILLQQSGLGDPWDFDTAEFGSDIQRLTLVPLFCK
jgi:hypothetical protein